MILEIATLQFLWVANAAVGAFLLVLLAIRKNYRLFPAFSLLRYEVQVNAADRLIAAGFCIYSCFGVLNDTILERYLRAS